MPPQSHSAGLTRTGRPRLLSRDREESLRARLVARDPRALSELIDVASPWLLGLMQGMLHDRDEAEDVALETFRIAWDKIRPPPAGETAVGLVPWLLTIARNRAIDRLRTRRRRARLGEIAAAGTETWVPAEEPDEAGQAGWHVHTEVHRALAALPAEQLEVVRLAYFEGRTHSEIADRLSIPLGTVKTRLRLGVGRLRERLAGLKDWIV